MTDLTPRLSVSQHRLHEWTKAQQMSPDQRQAQGSQADEMRRLKSELKQVTEERGILKSPQRTLPSSPGEVRFYQVA